MRMDELRQRVAAGEDTGEKPRGAYEEGRVFERARILAVLANLADRYVARGTPGDDVAARIVEDAASLVANTGAF